MRLKLEWAASARRAGPWLLLAAWPIVLALANPKWMYDAPINDPYIYLGAFLRLPIQLHNWSELYFYSRLAFILPGYVAYRLFPPALANAALDFAYFYGSILTLFVLLRRQVGLRAALFAALLIGGYSHFLESVGWDYVDGAGVMYLLIAVWAFSRGLTSARAWIWMLVAGLALGAGAHTHLFTLALWPVLGLYVLLQWPAARRWRGLLAAGLFTAAGALILTACLSVASQALGGPFAFYRGSFNFLRANAGLSSNPWLPTPLIELLPSASWLMPPAVLWLAALVCVGRQAGQFRAWAGSPRGAFVLIYVAAAGWLGLIAAYPLTPVLSTGSYVSYLIPFMGIALGALAAPALSRLSLIQWRALLSLLLVSLPAAIVVEAWSSAAWQDWVTHRGGWVVLAGLLAGFGLIAIRRADFTSLSGAVLAFAVVNPFGPSATTALLIPDAAARRATFLQVVAAVRAIDTAWPGQQPWLWFNYQQDPAYEMTACALTACHRNVISREFPAFRVAGLDTSSAPLLVPGRPVVLLSRQPDALTLVSAAAGSQVSAPVEQFVRPITAGPQPFNLYFLREPESGWQVTLPPAAWLAHQPQTAVVQPDGSFLSDPQVTQPGFMAYGPYLSLPPGEYAVTFWLSAQPAAAAGELARLDVAATAPVDFVGSQRVLQAGDFTGNSGAQPFRLTFSNGSLSNILEFRVQTMNRVPLTLWRIQMNWLGAYASAHPLAEPLAARR